MNIKTLIGLAVLVACGTVAQGAGQADATVRQDAETTRKVVESARAGLWGEVQALLASGADINASYVSDDKPSFRYDTHDAWGYDAIGHAGLDITPFRRSALGVAVLCGNPEMVRALIGAGADVNVDCGDGATPLMLASLLVGRQHGREIVNMLIEAGADVNAKRGNGLTPLHYVAFRGREEDIRAMLAAGADPEARDAAGRTYTFFTALLRHQGVFAAFLPEADARARDANGLPLLSYAIAGRQPLHTVRRLLADGADVNAADAAGYTPLMLALRQGARLGDAPVEYIRALLDAGADVNARDAEGVTPLMHAVGTRCMLPEVLELLLEHGADVNAADGNGDTALHRVANLYTGLAGDASIIQGARVLLAAGADPNAGDKDGWTPLSVAVLIYHKRGLVEALLQAGADPNTAAPDGLGLLGHMKNGSAGESKRSALSDMARALGGVGFENWPLHPATRQENRDYLQNELKAPYRLHGPNEQLAELLENSGAKEAAE